MADMELRRKSDNLVLCDAIYHWSGWHPYAESPVKETITGMPVEFSQDRALVKVTTAHCAFGFEGSVATDARYWEVVRLHRRKQFLVFRDRFGVETDVRALVVPAGEVAEEVHHKTLRRVEITLVDPRPIW